MKNCDFHKIDNLAILYYMNGFHTANTLCFILDKYVVEGDSTWYTNVFKNRTKTVVTQDIRSRLKIHVWDASVPFLGNWKWM